MIAFPSTFATTSRPGSFEQYKPILNAIRDLAGGNPCLDLGCGEAHVTKEWNCDYMDLVIRPTSPAKTINADIRTAPDRFAKLSFNLVVMSDVIEHLTAKDGVELLDRLSPLTKAIFIFTPIGPWRMDKEALDPDSHKSGWTPENFTTFNWSVWEWPFYHSFESGDVLGAFFAWRFKDHVVTVDEISKLCGVPI